MTADSGAREGCLMVADVIPKVSHQIACDRRPRSVPAPRSRGRWQFAWQWSSCLLL